MEDEQKTCENCRNIVDPDNHIEIHTIENDWFERIQTYCSESCAATYFSDNVREEAVV